MLVVGWSDCPDMGLVDHWLQRMRESEVTLGRLQQQGALGNGPGDDRERERERERERWSLLRAARDEADRSLSLAASLADKEAALLHAHATIQEVNVVTKMHDALVFKTVPSRSESSTSPLITSKQLKKKAL